MTLTRRVVLEAMDRAQKNYHMTVVYTAIITTLILILQLVQLFKGAA